MKTFRLVPIFASLAFLCLPAVQAQTRAQMNEMAYRDEAKADAAMNVAYKKLMATLDAPDQPHLRKAQRAWLVFRDAEATFEATQETGGTMYPTVHAAIVQELTEARTKQLRSALTTQR